MTATSDNTEDLKQCEKFGATSKRTLEVSVDIPEETFESDDQPRSEDQKFSQCNSGSTDAFDDTQRSCGVVTSLEKEEEEEEEEEESTSPRPKRKIMPPVTWEKCKNS